MSTKKRTVNFLYGRRNKYHNRKIERDGLVFDSAKEYRRWCDLLLLQKAGEISGLQRQVTFPLLPHQYEHSTEVYAKGPNKGKPKPGRLIERKVDYVADFVYYDKDGRQVVEDTKGVRTKDYIIKRKLMLYTYGIRIREV